MKTYMLLMYLFNPLQGGVDTYILDFNLTAEDCIEMQSSFMQPLNLNAHFMCEMEI